MKAEELLKSLTLEEKIGQLVQPYGKSLLRADPETGAPMRDPLGITDEELPLIGSVLDNSICDGATGELKHFRDNLKGKVPLIAMHDVIHGCDTIFPIALGLACSFEPELMKECSYISGEEAKAHNILVAFGPMTDLVRDARWGRVMETTGEDPLVNAQMAVATVEGFHQAGVAACVKHFAAYGLVESGRDYNPVQIGERALREYFLPSYKAAIDAGADMIMTSYNTINDIPATGNRWLMKDILRDEWGFDGIIISDSGAVKEMIPHGFAKDQKEAACYAANATVDLDMSSTCYLRHLKELVEEGKVDESFVDDACLRILKLKERLGVLDNPVKYETYEDTKKAILKPEYIASAQKCAEKSAVLLKNDGVLPLSDKVKKIALIGPFADTEEILGNWICFGPKHYGKGVIKTVREAVEARVPDCEIVTVPACTWALDDETTDFAEAVAAAKDADAVVLCIGEHQLHSAEGNSRVNIGLPKGQMELARQVCAANPNTAALLFCGRPLTIVELHDICPSILCMWQPGTAGGTAAARLLFGDVNPSGKLTMTWPRAVGQCPLYYNQTRTGRPCWGMEVQKKRSMTSNYIDEFTYPLYNFGHGLSYTKFEYTDAALSADSMKAGDTLTLSVKVKNAGDREGQEVVQLYIRDMVGSVVRPIKELKNYKKITLAPGEETVVEFKITEETLRFWRADMTFGSEAGDFTAMVGTAANRVTQHPFVLE